MTRAARATTLAVVLAATAGCGIFGRRNDVAAALRARRLMVPVAGIAPDDVPDTFDQPRDGGSRRHAALDIRAPYGTPVLSADDGTVLAVRDNRLGGRTLYTTDPDGRFVYYYAHLASRSPGLRPGTSLARGDVLGHVGSSGNAEVPHLHFQVMIRPTDGRWWDGRPIDPRPFLVEAGAAR